VEYWPYLAKCLARFLKIFFIDSKTPFGSFGIQARSRGILSVLNYRPRFSVARWPYWAKCLARFLKIFFMIL
jgi:hypothetical protein